MRFDMGTKLSRREMFWLAAVKAAAVQAGVTPIPQGVVGWPHLNQFGQWVTDNSDH